MVKYFAIIVTAFVTATLGVGNLKYLGPIDGPGGGSSYVSSYVPSFSYRTVIYDGQTYDNGLLTAGFVITAPSKVADDFEVDGDWTLETIRVWLFNFGSGDILVEIFGDSGAGPDDGNILFSETVNEADQTWTNTGDSSHGLPIYEVDILISGFVIGPGTRYWLSLQSEDDSDEWWVVTDHDPEWWEMCYAYWYGTWYSSQE